MEADLLTEQFYSVGPPRKIMTLFVFLFLDKKYCNIGAESIRIYATRELTIYLCTVVINAAVL